jgi:RND superfamily putative drug exporter
MQMLITVTAPDSATGPAARAVGLAIVDQLKRSPNVAEVTSAWTAPPAAAKRLVSKDGKTALVVAGISGGESVAQTTAQTLADGGARSPGRDDWRRRPSGAGSPWWTRKSIPSCSAICC